MFKSILCCVFMCAVGYSTGARILAIIPTPSYSHQVAFHRIWRELSIRGHQVTLLTTDPIKDPALTNLTEIDLHFSYDLFNNKHNFTDLIDKSQDSPVTFIKGFVIALNDIINAQLEHPEVQKLIKRESGEGFDLVMAEFLYPSVFAFAELYQCPMIGVLSLEAGAAIYHPMGNPSHPVLHPDVVLNLVVPLNFFERVISSLYVVFMDLYADYVMLPAETLLIRKHFGEHFPSAGEIWDKKSNLLFLNEDHIFNVIRPLVPTIIQIGAGSHLQEPKPLPKDLQEFLDGGREGVIYFSLGTNVKHRNIQLDTVNIILETFAELPYRVLWKTDADVAEKPDNVRLSKWLPQLDVLRHPNVKLFITQGGLQSIQEAIYTHTPMVGLPVFADQPTNMKKMAAKGIALHLDHRTMTKEEFKGTVLEVMTNPKYRNQIKKLAELAQDQPMTGLEKAVWWTEYVLRHKGAKHLRSPALDLPSYQYYLLDVIGFCFGVIGIVIYLLVLIVRLLYKALTYLSFKTKIKVS